VQEKSVVVIEKKKNIFAATFCQVETGLDCHGQREAALAANISACDESFTSVDEREKPLSLDFCMLREKDKTG